MHAKTCIKSLVTEIGMCYQVKTTAIVDNTLKLLPFDGILFYYNIYTSVGGFFCALISGTSERSPTSREVLNGLSRILLGGAEKMRVKITLACSECKQRNYDTMKNKKNDPDRLEMNKFCRFCRKHTLHKETK